VCCNRVMLRLGNANRDGRIRARHLKLFIGEWTEEGWHVIRFEVGLGDRGRKRGRTTQQVTLEI